MKFDLLSALDQMRETFGTKGKICIKPEGLGYYTILSFFSNYKTYNYSFFITYEAFSDSAINLFELEFKKALKALKLKLGTYND